jgi:hypothetical protein
MASHFLAAIGRYNEREYRNVINFDMAPLFGVGVAASIGADATHASVFQVAW